MMLLIRRRNDGAAEGGDSFRLTSWLPGWFFQGFGERRQSKHIEEVIRSNRLTS